MAPIAQARPDAHVFMQLHMVNSGGQASRSVFIMTSYLGAILSLRDPRRDRFALQCAMDVSSQCWRCQGVHTRVQKSHSRDAAFAASI